MGRYAAVLSSPSAVGRAKQGDGTPEAPCKIKKPRSPRLGAAGFDKMQRIMADFRAGITSFAGKKVIKCNDYKEGVDGLPKSDVLKYFLEDHCSVVVRPSGTEPKLKTYISVSAENREKAVMVEQDIACELERKMK